MLATLQSAAKWIRTQSKSSEQDTLNNWSASAEKYRYFVLFWDSIFISFLSTHIIGYITLGSFKGTGKPAILAKILHCKLPSIGKQTTQIPNMGSGRAFKPPTSELGRECVTHLYFGRFKGQGQGFMSPFTAGVILGVRAPQHCHLCESNPHTEVTACEFSYAQSTNHWATEEFWSRDRIQVMIVHMEGLGVWG